MKLYRIISKEEWLISKNEGKVPRCKSDERDNCIHLNKYEDITLVTNKYFVKEEEPVVTEVDSPRFEDKLKWEAPTPDKPWLQPNLFIENIPFNTISRFCYLTFNNRTESFEIQKSFK